MSIITYPLNGITYDASDAETYMCTRTSGVFSAEDSFNYTITDDMEITIGTGIAWVKNDSLKGKSICNNSPIALSVSLGDAYYPRIDRVVIEFSVSNNASTIKIIEGTPAASPTAPSIVQTNTVYQLGLYKIAVARAATAITAENITDTRLDESVCGIMRDAVEGIPTGQLQSQFMAWFESMQEFLSDEDVAVNSLQLDGHSFSYFNDAMNAVNYLDNADWSTSLINQRGESTYTGSTSSYVYGVDRWFIHSEHTITINSLANLSFDNDSAHKTHTSVTLPQGCIIGQAMDRVPGEVIGKEMCFSIDIGGNIEQGVISFPATKDGVSTLSLNSCDVSLKYGLYGVVGGTIGNIKIGNINPYYIPYIEITAKSNITINRVMLEQGRLSHMSIVPPRSPEYNLRICQQYYIEFSPNMVLGYGYVGIDSSRRRAFINVSIPSTMRGYIKGTVSLSTISIVINNVVHTTDSWYLYAKSPGNLTFAFSVTPIITDGELGAFAYAYGNSDFNLTIYSQLLRHPL